MQQPSSDLFRQTLSRFTTGVCVITALTPEGTPVGITVNSFTSVSLDPPLVLFCLKKAAARYPVFAQSNRYSISILSQDQKDLSRHFATQTNTPWEELCQTLIVDFPPFIKGSLAQIACEREHIYDAGDHCLHVARVVGMHFDPHKQPLVFFSSQYKDLFCESNTQLTSPLAHARKAS
jgi:3-hydroxy-9,10-secoandrosta-1,3,5(10)-triene-9,17-dione monooxygenase reductase component